MNEPEGCMAAAVVVFYVVFVLVAIGTLIAALTLLGWVWSSGMLSA